MGSLVTDLLTTVLDACAGDRSGVVADPVPELGMIDPDAFGICVATADGHLYEVGDSRAPFPIQSISKAFTYGLALQDAGTDAVDRRIDVEPSGDAYNEISLDHETGRPRNPMINAGAIAAASLVAGDTAAEQFDRVHRAYSAFADRDLRLSDEIYDAEVRVGHRNRAISHMLREFGILDGDPNQALDVYLRQCSLLVDCRDLALMGATLATGGIQPRSGARLLTVEDVERILSVMTTCGMYDAAGSWAARVGLPAKSGVGGGILAVLPGQVSIAVFSPRLDGHGNSVRGVATCHRLSNELGLHFLHVARDTHSAIRREYDVAEVPSMRERRPRDADLLLRQGRLARVYELQGDLLFAGAEAVVRRVEADAPGLEVVVLDLRGTDEITDRSRRMLLDLHDGVQDDDCTVVLVDPAERCAMPPDATGDGPRRFPSVDAAITWCEERLLERHGVLDGPLAPGEHPLLDDLGEHGRALMAFLDKRRVASGTRIASAGDAPRGLFLLLDGRVVVTEPAGGTMVSRASRGTSFGHGPLVNGHPHRLHVDADGDVALLHLTPDAFARMATDAPALRAALVEAMLRAAYRTADRMLLQPR
ncbi:MAG: glutaminase A [Solirubrobacteraceae bacterium]|nr:glutaminase A [Solirubrobacteraceae bacterium]